MWNSVFLVFKLLAMAPTVNRFAVALRPKQPFIDWINRTDSKEKPFTAEKVALDNAVYLITESTESADPDEILQDAWADIFEYELEGWCTDADFWPQDRSYRLFREWFEVEVHTVVYDLSVEPLFTEVE